MVSAVTIAVAVVILITDLKIDNATNEIPRLASELVQLDNSLDDLSRKIVSLDGKLIEFERRTIAAAERIRDIKQVESDLVVVNTRLGGYDAQIKILSDSTQDLSKALSVVDMKIFGTETKSKNVESIVEKVTTDVESITSEMDTQSDQLEMITDVVKTGFEDEPKVQPLLKHIAKADQQSNQSPEEILETIGQIKSENNNDPDEVSDKMSAELGVDQETARGAADERLSKHLGPDFFEMIPAAALPETEQAPGSGLTANPFVGMTIKADPRGESILTLCKRYQSQVPVGSCYDYFLRLYANREASSIVE